MTDMIDEPVQWYVAIEPVGADSANEKPVYRSDALLLPAAEFGAAEAAIAELVALLAPLNLSITPLVGRTDADEIALDIVGTGDNQPDAPAAFATLRGAAGLSPAAAGLVKSMSLDRLLFTGLPAKDGFGEVGREAVAVIAPAPARRPIEVVRRRPVVALLDSGVGGHGWWDADRADPFVIDATDQHWVPRAPARALRDRPSGDSNPQDRTIDSHAGHGTFIAGLIRQLAPDARVLSLHAMQDGGALEESLVLDALHWLLDRVCGAVDDPTRFVDVVCLSFGYYEHIPEDSVHTGKLRQVLGDLGDLGVRVVAAAGNLGKTDPVLPAVLAAPEYYAMPPKTRLLSVGALNPDGSRASYSNHGVWVKRHLVGSALVSTIPRYGHELAVVDIERYDPSNLVSGFARWSGTSFATGVLAGRLAGALVDDQRCVATTLQMDRDACHDRAAWALEVVDGRDG